ncbi:MAG: peptidase S8, partial [Verrucomicrobiaceae bacterium]
MNVRPPTPVGSQNLPAIPLKRPPARRLRVYAFDPSLSLQLENAFINHVTLKVPWEDECAKCGDQLQPGPVGEYVEVVDYDPASECFYALVDLNQPYLLAQDGLEPSEGNPQFHQQMVYAVAMTTIRKFERALGRKALWAPRRPPWKPGQRRYEQEQYVQRLRIYPHALREANAYYSPEKKALLFGYFPASETDSRLHLAGGTVFTCLSHDIVAHETAHALLDGMHRRFNEASNPDVLAFHEAFADIVALFQHFSFPEVLRHQIAKTRGDLGTENLLAQLAQQFGSAIGSHGSLRDALGRKVDGVWKRAEPDPTRINETFEPHDRGAILVAAIFDAFVSIYKRRTADLLRIATSGTGVLSEGALSPDLVNRLAAEASKCANHVLTMCIRALDYCPPVDLTFGDYLRALITFNELNLLGVR